MEDDGDLEPNFKTPVDLPRLSRDVESLPVVAFPCLGSAAD